MKNNTKFDELVATFEKLPGVGKKSALRYAYHISINDPFLGLNLANSIENAVRNLRRCEVCGAICEDEICEVCCDTSRDREKICIVESPKDILIFEENAIFDGLYFVLDSSGDEIIAKLQRMIESNDVKELIFAMTPGVNSDMLMLYVEDKISIPNLKFSKIAQGIPTGVSVDSIDFISLSKALKDRVGI
ncbi:MULTISPECIES: recombination mediator RecR [Campylobacter]|uniref:recombination mediator RecR n=1 Tax=Campylobacter TaxID=194 RepID=UPI0023F46759|nr:MULTISPECIES: recombination mediator RecR [Campylobacter]MCI6641849.1 recombination mediator RecR [Campylobacter sp.]MDD7421972.1 recombination mediator RecR [Campylobacter hominis]MDY3116546.1 recombination mediator RecR [Campylobacter hominis]